MKINKGHSREIGGIELILLVIVGVVSWVEYQLFETVEPWVRVAGISLSWAILGALILKSVSGKK